jgi:hypothetical protein
MHKKPRSSTTVQVDPGEEMLARLQTAMHAWALRHREPAALVEARVDELYQAWAEWTASADDPQLDVGRRPAPAPPRPAKAAGDPQPETPARTAARAKQTFGGRAAKQSVDASRAAYILKRYAALRDANKQPRAARVQVAAEINEQRHLPRKDRKPRPPLWRGTYSEGSVQRVLKRHGIND